jgi:hypothetical protein
MALTSTPNIDEQQSLWKWTFPEEDRYLYTTASWQGGYRWFRSTNVVPIEQWWKKRGGRVSSTPGR